MGLEGKFKFVNEKGDCRRSGVVTRVVSTALKLITWKTVCTESSRGGRKMLVLRDRSS